MKKTTCRALHGPCDAAIYGETPEEMGDNCKRHVMEMMRNGDAAHASAVADMQKMSETEQKQWYEDFKRNFASLPDA